MRTYDTLVLGDGAESDTRTSITGDVPDGDIGRVGLQGNAVITTLIDHILCIVSYVFIGENTQHSRTVTFLDRHVSRPSVFSSQLFRSYVAF
jgi:hypothetical protein